MTRWAADESRLSDEILASLTAGLMVLGTDCEIRIVNPAGRRMLGLAGAGADTGYGHELPGPLAKVVRECLETRRPIVRRSVRLTAGDDRPQHVGVTISPLQDAAGGLHGAICLFTDLTSVLDLEEQLRLKDSLARVGELTAGIAHEFRNGLATIHGYSRLIDLEAIPPPFRSYIEGIRAETRALEEVVTNFLNFAKPEQLIVGPVDLAAIAERAADEQRGEARIRGGQIEVTGRFASVDGDDVLLRQAFSNLVRNALEACAGAGVAPRIVIEGQIDDRQALCRVEVNDNGPGIDPSIRERIFRPFFTTKSRGTGLGLALVLKIVVTHNGRVTVGNSPLGGASLQVTLPLSSSRT